MSDETKQAVTEENVPAVEAAADSSAGEKKGKVAKPRSKKKKIKYAVATGCIYIQATYNNTIVTVTDPNGNVLAWSSAGLMGFKGPKKATPYAAGLIVKDVAEKAKPYGLKEVSLFIKGIGAGRDGAIRAVYANGLNILSIKDVTPIPHNGCRPPKVRRV